MTIEDGEGPLEVAIERAMAGAGLKQKDDFENMTPEKLREVGRVMARTLGQPEFAGLVATEMLENFIDLFPREADAETQAAQALFVGPYIAQYVLGRGIRIQELSNLLNRPRPSVYRWMSRGLAIMFVSDAVAARPGVNRRYSGRDPRYSYYRVNKDPLESGVWPEHLENVRDLLEGLSGAMKSIAADSEIGPRLREAFMPVYAALLVDPRLPDLFDGIMAAGQRLGQSVRDRVCKTAAEKEKAQKFVEMLQFMSEHKPELLAAVRESASRLKSPVTPLPPT